VDSHLWSRLALASLLAWLVLAPSPTGAAGPGSERAPQAAGLGDVLLFVENRGQFAAPARYLAYGGTQSLWLAQDALWIVAAHPDGKDGRTALRLSFPGADPRPRLEPLGRALTLFHYFLGSDPSRWAVDVPAWRGVRYVDLYPGVDLEIDGREGRWSWRLVVQQEARIEPHRIALRIQGAQALEVTAAGVRLDVEGVTLPLLQIAVPGGEALLTAQPRISGDRIVAPIAPVRAEEAATPPLAALTGSSDLVYASFIGGSDFDKGNGVAVDGEGAPYVTGYAGHDMPTSPGAYDPTYNGGLCDAFVAKLAPDGSDAVYVTFVGGSDDDMGSEIAVDATGAAFVVGQTYSGDFPTTSGSLQEGHPGGSDAFVFKLNPQGNGLVYSTYLGGSGWDSAASLVLDVEGAAYLVGTTKSDDFPTTPGAYDTGYQFQSVFLSKLNAQGSALLYSTYLGGSLWDWGYDVAVDGSGAAYVTGDTYGSGFPTTSSAFDTTHSGQYEDAFVAKFSPDGRALDDLLYATFLGGIEDDWGESIALHPASRTVYVAGFTTSADMPVTAGTYDTVYGGGVYGDEPYGDAYLAKIHPGSPRVTGMSWCIGGPYYFRPWPLPASTELRAQVDWRDYAPDRVRFDLNGVAHNENASGALVAHSLDLQDLDFGPLGQQNTLLVQAYAQEGLISPPYVAHPIGVESPAWLPLDGVQLEIPVGCSGQPMAARWSVAFPDPAIEARVTPPSWFPFIGGSPLGLQRTQAGLDVEFRGSGQGSATVYGQTGFDAAEGEVTGRVSGQGSGSIVQGQGMQLQDVSLGLDLEGMVQSERPLIDVLCNAASGGACPLREAEQAPVVGDLVRWFNERARFEATVRPGLHADLGFSGDGDGWQWREGTGTARVQLALALVLDMVEDMITAEGYGGGEPSITLQTPPDPLTRPMPTRSRSPMPCGTAARGAHPPL
jgi:hypothetical protein